MTGLPRDKKKKQKEKKSSEVDPQNLDLVKPQMHGKYFLNSIILSRNKTAVLRYFLIFIYKITIHSSE